MNQVWKLQRYKRKEPNEKWNQMKMQMNITKKVNIYLANTEWVVVGFEQRLVD